MILNRVRLDYRLELLHVVAPSRVATSTAWSYCPFEPSSTALMGADNMSRASHRTWADVSQRRLKIATCPAAVSHPLRLPRQLTRPRSHIGCGPDTSFSLTPQKNLASGGCCALTTGFQSTTCTRCLSVVGPLWTSWAVLTTPALWSAASLHLGHTTPRQASRHSRPRQQRPW
jgi:hypothetical protein